MQQQIAVQLSAEIARRYADFRDVTKQAGIHKTLIEIHVSEIEADLYFLKNNLENFTPGVQERLVDILRELIKSYREAAETFSYARGPDGNIMRGAWVVKLKDALEILVKDMERWQRRFLDYIQCLHFTGFGFRETVIVRVGTIRKAPSNAQSLGANLNEAREDFNSKSHNLCLDSLPVLDKHLVDIPLSLPESPLKIPDSAASRQDFLVEYRPYSRSDDLEYLREIVRYTAYILAAAKPCEMHILCCEGYVHRPELRQFQTILKLPQGMGSPQTLRECLLYPHSDGEPSLTARVELCKQIATAALYVHTASLVHKAIRPEAFVLLQSITTQPESQPDTLPFKSSTFRPGTPFLTGFGQARQETPDTYSSLRLSLSWEQDLYSHPTRQGKPTAKYTMAHDIYSIGVILLEIGLWRSFIMWNGIKDFIVDERVLEGGNTILKRIKERQPRAGEDLKDLYQAIAEQELPCVMGERFCKIVLQCLNVVEDEFCDGEAVEQSDMEVAIGMSREKNEEETVGLKYIKTVLNGFEEIKV